MIVKKTVTDDVVFFFDFSVAVRQPGSEFRARAARQGGLLEQHGRPHRLLGAGQPHAGGQLDVGRQQADRLHSRHQGDLQQRQPLFFAVSAEQLSAGRAHRRLQVHGHQQRRQNRQPRGQDQSRSVTQIVCHTNILRDFGFGCECA